MDRYLAEVLYMDTNLVAKNLGTLQAFEDAEQACERHASTPLKFQSRVPGISKAQGEKYWYRITQLKAQQTSK